jgi:DNA-binding GntR family transcriptional regulator
MDHSAQTISVAELSKQLDCLPAADGAPKYARLAAAFRACIRGRRFRPGDQVPSETELCAQLPLGLGTVQKALAELAAEGLVTRQRRRGTFIADSTNQVPEVHVYRYRDTETGDLLLPFTRVLGLSELTPEEHAAQPDLAAALGADVLRIDRLVWVDREPPAFSSLYLRREHGQHLLDLPLENLHGTSLHRHLLERFHLPTLSVRHEVAARPLSEAACHHLGLFAPHVGLVWSAHDIGLDDHPLLIQRFELRQGHRPMEIWEGKPAGPAASAR